MSLVENLLAVADGKSKVVDFLFQRSQKKSLSHYDSMCLGASPSREVALREAARGGVAKAVAVATYSDDPEVLSALAVKDKRLTVLRAVATNPHTDGKSLVVIAIDAIKRGDQETAVAAGNRLSAKDVLMVLKVVDGAHTDWMAGAARRASERADILEFLECTYPELVTTALDSALRHRCAVIDADEALAHANIAPAEIASVLWYSGFSLAKRHAALVTDHLDATGYMSPYHGSVDQEAAHLLAARSEQVYQMSALTAPLDDTVFDLLAKSGHRQVVIALAGQVTRPEHASQVLPRLVESRGDHAERHMFLGEKREIERFLKEGLLTGDDIVTALRAGVHDITQEWLTGRYTCTPTVAHLRAIVAEPGMAFMSYHGSASVSPEEINAHLRRMLAHGVAADWAEIFLDEVPGYVGDMLSDRRRSDGLGHLYRRTYAVFGEETRLWELMLSFGPGFPGTLTELHQLCSATAGIPLQDATVAGDQAP